MIILPTVAVRTSIDVWKPPIVVAQQDRKHLLQQAHTDSVQPGRLLNAGSHTGFITL